MLEGKQFQKFFSLEHYNLVTMEFVNNQSHERPNFGTY